MFIDFVYPVFSGLLHKHLQVSSHCIKSTNKRSDSTEGSEEMIESLFLPLTVCVHGLHLSYFLLSHEHLHKCTVHINPWIGLGIWRDTPGETPCWEIYMHGLIYLHIILCYINTYVCILCK